MAAEQEELDAALAAYKPCEGLLQNAAQVDFMLCGIGMASACYTITRKIYEAKAAGKCYDIAILVGLAGSYDIEDFPIGSVALIEKAYIGDLGFDTPSGLKTLFDTKVLDSNIFPFKDGETLCLGSDPNLAHLVFSTEETGPLHLEITYQKQEGVYLLAHPAQCQVFLRGQGWLTREVLTVPAGSRVGFGSPVQEFLLL